MTTAFQADAFQFTGFQIDASGDVLASADQTIGQLYQVARGKRNKNWPRLGPTPDHDTEYERWRSTDPQRET